MRHAYGNANGNCHIHSDSDCDGNCHIHSDGDRDIYCNSYSYSYSYSNCDRTASAYTDATPSADTAGPSEHLLLRQF
jgi:hypothetical protein